MRIDHICIWQSAPPNARFIKSQKEHGKENREYGSKTEILMPYMDAAIRRNGRKHAMPF